MDYYFIIEFIVITIITYLLYYYLFMKRNLKKDKKPIEFLYLESTYRLQLDKINKTKLNKLISLCNALIIATTVLLIDFIDFIVLQLFVGFIILIILIVIVYYFIGLYYKKRGMTKDV